MTTSAPTVSKSFILNTSFSPPYTIHDNNTTALTLQSNVPLNRNYRGSQLITIASSSSSAANQTHINGKPNFGPVPPPGHSAFPLTAAIDKPPLKDKPGFQSWFLEGGEVKEEGVRKDGGAFWTMSKIGVPPLGFPRHQVKREEVSMCDATVAQVNWASVEVDQRGREVWVVISSTKCRGIQGQAEVKVEGVFGSLEGANGRVKDIARGDNESLN